MRADSPYKTFNEYIEAARKHPGKIDYGSTGIGTSPHLLMEELAGNAKVSLNHIPFKGNADLTQALLGGHVMAQSDASGWDKFVDGGQLRLLVTFGEKRTKRWPTVPTAQELGYNVVSTSPYGLVGPKGMDPAVVKTLHDAFKKAMDEPRHIELLDQLNQDVVPQRRRLREVGARDLRQGQGPDRAARTDGEDLSDVSIGDPAPARARLSMSCIRCRDRRSAAGRRRRATTSHRVARAARTRHSAEGVPAAALLLHLRRPARERALRRGGALLSRRAVRPRRLHDPGRAVARVAPTIARLFPEQVADTIAILAELHALSETLDSDTALHLPDGTMTPLDYVRAWQAVGRAPDREHQIELTLRIAAQLDRITRMPMLRNALRLMRGPARAAGLSQLQRSLETGFDVFRDMKGAQEFIDLIGARARAGRRAVRRARRRSRRCTVRSRAWRRPARRRTDAHQDEDGAALPLAVAPGRAGTPAPERASVSPCGRRAVSSTGAWSLRNERHPPPTGLRADEPCNPRARHDVPGPQRRRCSAQGCSAVAAQRQWRRSASTSARSA